MSTDDYVLRIQPAPQMGNLLDSIAVAYGSCRPHLRQDRLGSPQIRAMGVCRAPAKDKAQNPTVDGRRPHHHGQGTAALSGIKRAVLRSADGIDVDPEIIDLTIESRGVTG